MFYMLFYALLIQSQCSLVRFFILNLFAVQSDILWRKRWASPKIGYPALILIASDVAIPAR
jgi:hypothetical protein